MKKNEKENCQPTLEEKYAALKKTNAGIRGQMGLQAKRIKDLKKCVSELLQEKSVRDTKLTQLYNDYNFLDKAYKEHLKLVEEYNKLPWYKKIFCFNI